MGHLKELMLGREWWKLEPDRSLILAGSGDRGSYLAAARSERGQFVWA